MMEGLRHCTYVIAITIHCYMLLVVAQITDPSEVSALISVKGSLVDSLEHLKDWKKGDPCTSKWTGIFCYNNFGADGYLHVRELSLRNCFLQGSVPDFSRIRNLSYLDLSWNQLSGSIPQNKLSNNMTTINCENLHFILQYQLFGRRKCTVNELVGWIRHRSLENNFLNGSISTDIWQNRTFATTSRLVIDLRNNSVSNISGAFDPPVNVTLRFQGNPICSNRSIRNIDQYCGPDSGADDEYNNSTNPSGVCPIQACPTDNYYEYVPASPEPCFCASPLRIGYRLKSPSISYFDPYMQLFHTYVTSSLDLDLYQLWVDSYFWEKGPRLRMHLKLFPVVGVSTFNESEVLRISEIFASWEFPGSDLFGPYELLNFTLLGPYSYFSK